MNLFYPALTRYARARRRSRRRSVLLVAPHPDDDVIGCGGLLQRLAARGARVSVLYVTDGSASHVKSKRFPPPVLSAIREREARTALRALGLRAKAVFLRAPDGTLAELDAHARSLLVRSVAAQIDGRRAHLLLLPWHRDPHPDHIATAAIVEEAWGRAKRRPAAYFYGVWLPVRGTASDAPDSAEISERTVALTPLEAERKRAAIMEHRSQTGDLIDDDPEGFRIDGPLLAEWLKPVERFYSAPWARGASGGGQAGSGQASARRWSGRAWATCPQRIRAIREVERGNLPSSG